MKRLSNLLFILLLFNATNIIAGSNSDKYAKLKSLYESGKYEDCAFKAEGYSLKDDMRKDAEPYLYLSMSLYKLSMLSSKELDYPKAYSNAFKYAAKTAKYDKTGKIINENKDYFEELKETGIKEASTYFKSGNYISAAKNLDRILRFCPDDDYVRATKGICDILSKKMGEGNMELKTAFGNISKGLYPLTNSSKISQKLLSDAFVKYSVYLIEINMADSSKTTIDLAKIILPESQKLQNL